MQDIIEGRNPVLESLRAGRPIGKILLVKNIERHGIIGEIIHLAQISGIPFEYVDRTVINRLSQTGSNQGIIALTVAKEYVDIEELLSIPVSRNEAGLFIILDGVEDPHNLGAVIRTTDATGSHGVIIRERRAVGLTPVVEKASAGALAHVPVARVVNISKTIEILKENNIWIVGIDQSGDVNYTRVNYLHPTAIVIGSEGHWLSDLVKKHCDFLASIPMKGKINSLNASVAAGVVMYEVVRQRSGESKRDLNLK
jgi:23S rRNA (guanosine2251-2'-O)-methyltransferase